MSNNSAAIAAACKTFESDMDCSAYIYIQSSTFTYFGNKASASILGSGFSSISKQTIFCPKIDKGKNNMQNTFLMELFFF